jgi:hypothetical protein
MVQILIQERVGILEIEITIPVDFSKWRHSFDVQSIM